MPLLASRRRPPTAPTVIPPPVYATLLSAAFTISVYNEGYAYGNYLMVASYRIQADAEGYATPRALFGLLGLIVVDSDADSELRPLLSATHVLTSSGDTIGLGLYGLTQSFILTASATGEISLTSYHTISASAEVVGVGLYQLTQSFIVTSDLEATASLGLHQDFNAVASGEGIPTNYTNLNSLNYIFVDGDAVGGSLYLTFVSEITVEAEIVQRFALGALLTITTEAESRSPWVNPDVMENYVATLQGLGTVPPTVELNATDALITAFKQNGTFTKKRLIWTASSVGGANRVAVWKKDSTNLMCTGNFPTSSSVQGALFDGVDDFIQPNVTLTADNTMTVHLRGNTQGNFVAFGTGINGLTNGCSVYPGNGGSTNFLFLAGDLAVASTPNSGEIRRYFTWHVNVSQTWGFVNGVNVTGASAGGSNVLFSPTIGARNLSGVPDLFSPNRIAYAAIDEYLSDAQVAADYADYLTYCTTIGRTVPVV